MTHYKKPLSSSNRSSCQRNNFPHYSIIIHINDNPLQQIVIIRNWPSQWLYCSEESRLMKYRRFLCILVSHAPLISRKLQYLQNQTCYLKFIIISSVISQRFQYKSFKAGEHLKFSLFLLLRLVYFIKCNGKLCDTCVACSVYLYMMAKDSK